METSQTRNSCWTFDRLLEIGWKSSKAIVRDDIPFVSTTDGEFVLIGATGMRLTWIGLQSQYDLDIEEDELGDRIAREVKVYAEIH